MGRSKTKAGDPPTEVVSATPTEIGSATPAVAKERLEEVTKTAELILVEEVTGVLVRGAFLLLVLALVLLILVTPALARRKYQKGDAVYYANIVSEKATYRKLIEAFPEAWLEAAHAPHAEIGKGLRYGYQWWLPPEAEPHVVELFMSRVQSVEPMATVVALTVAAVVDVRAVVEQDHPAGGEGDRRVGRLTAVVQRPRRLAMIAPYRLVAFETRGLLRGIRELDEPVGQFEMAVEHFESLGRGRVGG